MSNPLELPFISIIVVGSPIDVIGFSGQFDDHYEVNPRFSADIKPAL
jgi:hypothetical protein